ncbi:MAG: radical SAM protein [Candidatus Schekmanbacteria bacterium]|nr:MAG: radical SAM protein [Candidatus Schekmanbacteria bacterium]
MGTAGYLRHIGKIITKKASTPIYLVFFITENCTANCLHCLLGEREEKTDELKIDEIEKISSSMDDILFLLLTGGEPFLRDDIDEIAYIFYKNNQIANLGIPSNGSLQEKVVEGAKKILERCKGVDFAIDISIDSIGEEHDRLRGYEGLFKKSIWTYKELKKLKEKYDNFNLNVALTASSFNQDRLKEIYDYLKNELGADAITYLLTRGNPRDPKAKKFDVQKYLELAEIIRKDTKESSLLGYENYFGSDLINAMKIIRQDVIGRIVKENRSILPCYAASLSAVILSNGDVYPCELLNKKMGNLREENFDFKQIWNNDKAKEIRKYIKDTKCFCTYECFLTNSILFTPSMFPKIFKEWLDIKKGKIFSSNKNKG